MTLTEALVGVAIAVGLVGIVIPVLPGSLLVIGAILVWAISVGSPAAWIVFALATVFVAIGTLVKFLVPGRRLQSAGVPTSTLWIGGLLGVIGFFVVPIVGLFLGFILGVYVAEAHRLGASQAWPATIRALKAVGLGIVIEMCAALLATVTWVMALLLL